MAAYLDTFTTDPFASRWVNERNTSVWDGTDFEIDADLASTSRGLIRYEAGSLAIEHEVQCTFSEASAFGGGVGGPAVRVDGGADDCYYVECYSDTGDIVLVRMEAGARTVITTFSAALSHARFDFLTIRLAAQGGNGANVSLSLWVQNHGATKPSDPGWIGVDGAPDYTFTDTAAGRLDDAALHIDGGIGFGAQGVDADTRHCFWRARDISERGGGGGPVALPFRTVVSYQRVR